MILGFKGFKPGLVATLGNGKFQYVPNELNETKKAMCASTGFHYCLDPWDCLNWYTWNGKNEFWAVAAGGDVDEDGYGSRSSCTKLVPLRKLTAEEFLLMLVWTKTRVYMRGHEKRWFAVARTATKPENMQGFHEDNMLFVVDEASGVADPIMEAIQGTLSGDNNRLLMCGNPTQNTGTFHDSHTVDAQSYYCMKVSSRDSPRTNKQNIADLERKFGKNSNVVRVRVDGEFPENEDDVFIPMALATKAVNTEPLEHCSPARISIGCDVARFGNDDTAIAQNIDGDIQKLVTRHGQDLYATADDIIAIYKTLRAAYPQYRGLIYAVIDDTGVGGGVTDILNREKIRQKLTKLMVVPVNFSSAVPDKEAAGRYADIATWMWAVLRDMATAGTLHIPNDSTLIGQLTTRKYIFSGAPAKLKLESKDALKKRGLTSPDRADAVALALYEGGIFDVRSLI